LRGNFPFRVFRQEEPEAHRDLIHAVCPDKSSGHVEMGVSLINAVVSAVRTIPEERVLHDYRALVARHFPRVRVAAIDFENMTFAVRDFYAVDVFHEFMQGIAPGRGATHHHVKRRLRDPGKGGADFRLMVSCVGKADFIADPKLLRGLLRRLLRGLLRERCSGDCEKEEGEFHGFPGV
jgi:hypothetical protein